MSRNPGMENPKARGARPRGPVTSESVGPLSRPVSVAHLPPDGLEETVEATAEERAALAGDFNLPAIHKLTAHFKLTGSVRRVRVVGRVEAAITQTCILTLDPFDSVVEEAVEVEFAVADDAATRAGGLEDPPDPIVNGEIDLGSLTAEFLALGLDPYPKKPGVDFAYEAGNDLQDSPFAGLGRLKDGK